MLLLLLSVSANPFVYLLVFDEVRLLAEGFATHLAPEWLLPCVGT
jgi:hypothetical protein